MNAMFRKVNAREHIVGWYHTGPKLHPNDIAIHELIAKFCANPVLVIVDAKPRDLGLPTDAYYSVEEVHDDGTPTTKTFEHVASEIGAEEAEEVGVEHLLRDIQDKTVGTLSQRISSQLHSLQGLFKHLEHIRDYLQKVVSGKLPMNHTILYQLQDIFNLLPNLHLEEFATAFAVKTNDQLLLVYLASLIRSVLALHNLIGNKVSNTKAERKDSSGGDKTAKKEVAGEGKDGEKKSGKKAGGDKQSDEKTSSKTGDSAADKKDSRGKSAN
jgi:26S proteasome regulatory subunit N8